MSSEIWPERVKGNGYNIKIGNSYLFQKMILLPSERVYAKKKQKKKKKKNKKKQKKKTRGPWWSYIAHLSKQLCKLTVEVSAKFTALRFLYNFIALLPCGRVFFMHHDRWNWILKEGHQRNNLPSYIEIGPVASNKKIFEVFYIAI